MQAYGQGKGMAWVGLAYYAGPDTQYRGRHGCPACDACPRIRKKVKTWKQYRSLEEIAQDFAKDVKDAGGDLKDCPWQLPTAAPAPQAAASAQPLAQQSTILTFGADGSLDIGQLKDVFGMELGTTVTLKKDSNGIVFHIAKVSDTITLVGADNGKTTCLLYTSDAADE